jgi:hypothetical protein
LETTIVGARFGSARPMCTGAAAARMLTPSTQQSNRREGSVIPAQKRHEAR